MRTMLEQLGQSIERSPLGAGTLAVILLAAVSALDVLTGRETSLFLLYLVPISIAALSVGDKTAAALAIVAAIIATAVRVQGRPMVPSEFWNATTRVAILLSWALLLGRLRSQPGAASILRQLRLTLAIVVVLGLLTTGTAFVIEARPARPPIEGAASADNPTTRPEGMLGDLIVELGDCMALSRPLLLGSRDPGGISCVNVVKSGSVQNALPANIADYNGGPGTTLAALFYFDRAAVKSPVEDYHWHQNRLRRFLENERNINVRAAQASAQLARKAMELVDRLEDSDTLPPLLKATGFHVPDHWLGFCLTSLDAAVAEGNIDSVRRWSTEFAAASLALEDLHRWLAFLVENHLRALDFQKLGASLYADPSVVTQSYDPRMTISLFPAGSPGLNGVANLLEVERQAEQLMTIPTDFSTAIATDVPWKHGSMWVVPGVRDCYMKLHNSLSPANQKTWRQAARAPYEHSYMNNMLFRAWKSDSADAMTDALRRFDAAHPRATMDELMDAIMYRGHGFGGIEWADRYQPELLNPMPEAVFETDLGRFLAAAQLTSRFNQERHSYGLTFTLRDALAMKKLDCIRATDMIGAIHRNSGGTHFGFVNWSAGTCAHTVAAYLGIQGSEAQTLVLDGMSHSPQVEAWPNAFFNGHAWPPGFDGSPAPYSAELYARGIDNFIWVEGYMIRGPHAGTLARSAVPYLPTRDKSDVRKAFAGPYPP